MLSFGDTHGIARDHGNWRLYKCRSLVIPCRIPNQCSIRAIVVRTWCRAVQRTQHRGAVSEVHDRPWLVNRPNTQRKRSMPHTILKRNDCASWTSDFNVVFRVERWVYALVSGYQDVWVLQVRHRANGLEMQRSLSPCAPHLAMAPTHHLYRTRTIVLTA